MFPRTADNPPAKNCGDGLLLSRRAIATMHLPRIAVQAHPSVLAEGVARDGCVGTNACVLDAGLHQHERKHTHRCERYCSHQSLPWAPGLSKDQDQNQAPTRETSNSRKRGRCGKAGPNWVMLDPNKKRPSQMGRASSNRTLRLKQCYSLGTSGLSSPMGFWEPSADADCTNPILHPSLNSASEI